MKCYQCGKPAMFLVSDKDIPLCLDCNLKLVQTTTLQNEMLERQINYHSDLIDYTIGLPPSGPRFPVKKTVNLGGVSLHNIKVDNSTVGVINTGNIETVDVAVSALHSEGKKEFAEALNQLATAVIKSTELQDAAKNQIIELLSLIAAEATAPKERQRKGAMKALIAQLKDFLSISATMTQLWEKWGPTIQIIFA